jgi:formyl-CoA transferase
MYAFSGILAALYRRSTTGAGSHVEVSLFEALAEWMGAPMYYTSHGGQAPQRVGLEHATIAPYGPFVTADNRTIVIAVHSAKEWTALCETVLGAADLAADTRFRTNADRVANRVALSQIIAEKFAALDAETALARLDSAGLASARVNTMQELIDHPVLSGRKRWRDVETPGGRIAALLPPPTIDGLEPRMDAVPGLGEHTESVLQGVGFTHEQIAKFWADATI